MALRQALGRGARLGRALLWRWVGGAPRPPLPVHPPAAVPLRPGGFLREAAAWLGLTRSPRFFHPRVPLGPRRLGLAFSLGLALFEPALAEQRRADEACQDIQTLFTRRRKPHRETPGLPRQRGFRLEEYTIGRPLGKGCSAAVYEAAAPFGVGAAPQDDEAGPTTFPWAIKMMWNISAGSSSEGIFRSMSQELVPTSSTAIAGEFGTVACHSRSPISFGKKWRRLSPHPNVVRVLRAFTSVVPLLPGATAEYPDVLPPALSPSGLGHSRTLFLVMKNYPFTLRQFLRQDPHPLPPRTATLMLLQLLEGVDHLLSHGVAHRDLKADNILVEVDPTGLPCLVISDFGCCLADKRIGLKLPFTSWYVDRGGNSCLMAPEVRHSPSPPGRWPSSHGYEDTGMATQVLQITVRPRPNSVLFLSLQRLGARMAANVLHLSLWGRELLEGGPGCGLGAMVGWLLRHSAAALLQDRLAGRAGVESRLQACFLSRLDCAELCEAAALLHAWREPQ
ncbi:serine/threonine-protein kinase PINK1, mitochondrial [Anolis sagrei]|uniref:serine/threonine-protein kinase PINK1, mitochondrial n=1 Tax=Anolis sagrei TaxID=38937 RepID=UPI0035228AF5